MSRPRPASITPAASPGQPPAGALVLFDGTSLEEWTALDGSPEAQARVLDAAMDYLDLTHAKEIVHDPPPELSDRRHRLLVRRAKLGVPSAPLPDMLPEESAPHLSHPSMRLGVGGGVFGPGGTFAQLSFRPLLHDFADPHVGYPEHTRMELLPLTLRYELPAHRVRLEEWKLLRITNLTPLTRFALIVTAERDGNAIEPSQNVIFNQRVTTE